MYSHETVNEFGFQWMISSPNTYEVCGRTLPRFPAGAYRCWVDCYGKQHYHGQDLNVDELIGFSGSLADRILSEVDTFWQSGEQFARYGFLHRRGYLLYGKQGCGKSSLIHQIVSRIIAAGHVAFFCDEPGSFISCMVRFREVEPDRPMVCVFEDIDAIIKNYGDSALLQWLDGNHQVDKAVNLASTNYPGRLDRRIVARPRRFDRVLRIESPDEGVRRAYFARKLPELSARELQAWVEASEGLPFAALAELLISVQCLGNDLHEAADTLRQLDANSPESDFFQDEQQPAEAVSRNGA